jgi:uncharacterized membrane protein YdbT with pleckstrin-like domain
MLPSFIGCILATMAIALLTWAVLPLRLAGVSFVGLAGGIWLLQLVRWGYRFFAFNYRLTTRRLFYHPGWLYRRDGAIELADVAQVLVRSSWQQRLVGVGQVLVVRENPAQPPVVLEGVLGPARIAEVIRTCVQRAREHNVVQTRCQVS